MSLTWNAQAVPEDVRTIIATVDEPMQGIKAGDRILSPVTNTLIWATMAVGIGDINDDTAAEFHSRLSLLAKLGLFGTLSVFDAETQTWSDREITREEVEAHKGLTTNVFPQETRASFVKRWVTNGREIFPEPEPKKKR
jgi:hypothetical protein